MRTLTHADDDVDYLRNLLTPLDPAMPGRHPTASVRPGVTRRPSWAVAGLAAAAAVVAILAVAVPLLIAGGDPQTPASAPVARPSYDHVQWRDYHGTQLVDTVDWWWNGVDGRDLHRNASGAVISDVTLKVASTASDPVTPAGTAAPVPSLAPTSGTELTADGFPGVVPSTADAMADYLAQHEFSVAQGIASLVLDRHLDAKQMAALASLAQRLATDRGSPATDPTGRPVRLLTLDDSSGVYDGSVRIVVDADGRSVLGTTWPDGDTGQTWWSLITISELTSATK